MTITIYTEKHSHFLKQLVLKNINVKISIGSLNKTHFISYIIQDEDDFIIKTVFEKLSNIMTIAVLKAITSYLFDKHGLKTCCNINIKQDKIKNDIKDIIAQGTINIDGYINFRTREIKRDIEKTIIGYKRDLKINKDYLEFIKLMRYYVTTQSCKADILYISLIENNKYELFDSKKRNITQKMIDNYKKENDINEIDYNDCLIDTLFNLLPRKIIINDICGTRNIEILNTINLVFFNRIQIESSI